MCAYGDNRSAVERTHRGRGVSQRPRLVTSRTSAVPSQWVTQRPPEERYTSTRSPKTPTFCGNLHTHTRAPCHPLPRQQWRTSAVFVHLKFYFGTRTVTYVHNNDNRPYVRLSTKTSNVKRSEARETGGQSLQIDIRNRFPPTQGRVAFHDI